MRSSSKRSRAALRLAGRALLAALAVAAIAVAGYAGNVALGMRAHARYDGTVSGLALAAPVRVLRDDRGVPHVIAHNDHDLYFAQGYLEGSDRLFQMDLLRRFVEGRMAEILGPVALAGDERERAVPVAAIARAQWSGLGPRERSILQAFAQGVNAAMAREPLGPEFRILAYRPAPWTPQDSLAVAMALVLDLVDGWNDIAPRDAAYRAGGIALYNRLFPLSDPCYDAPVLAGLGGIGPGTPCHTRSIATLLRELAIARPPVGSNEWAAGASRTRTGRALLANDPHLSLHIPGDWYLIDLRAPGLHAAGAALPGLPGVVLGHNEHLAWGLTDGYGASMDVFVPPAHLAPAGWQAERFGVRFGKTATAQYYRNAGIFGVTTVDRRFVLVRWNAYAHPVSPLTAFLDLDTAGSIEQGMRALSKFPGPNHNVVLADTSGRVAYTLAGEIPDDPVWARWFHPAADLAKRYPPIPFDRLPHVAPSRIAVVWTANNKQYAGGYPYRLSAQYAPPYRAYRIAQLLRSQRRYDVAFFARMQMDALSLPERELVRDLQPQLRALDPQAAAALAAWNGEMRGDSVEATVAESLRLALLAQKRRHIVPLLQRARTAGGGGLRIAALASPAPWAIAGAVTVLHPLAPLGLDFLNGTRLPGYGDAFALHVQYQGFSQSFRAVWDVGNWDAGGITLPQGESGEPGSGHYTDQAAAWVAGRLWPLPFSTAAVERTAIHHELLLPVSP